MESHKKEVKSIPSEEDFEQADKLIAEFGRNLDQVSLKVKNRFANSPSLYKVYVLWQGERDFRTYVFFKTNSDVEKSRSDGTVQAIQNCIYEELEFAGRGKKEDVTVSFEFDSDENVTRNYEADYMLRLR